MFLWQIYIVCVTDNSIYYVFVSQSSHDIIHDKDSVEGTNPNHDGDLSINLMLYHVEKGLLETWF